MRRELSSLLILALTGLVASDVTAQQEQSDFVIRSETKLVLAPFHVIKKRNYIEGLSETDFELLVDGAPYEIGLFEGPASGDVPDGAEPGAKGRSVPVEIILLLDVSFSVINRGLLDVYTLKEEVLDHLGDEVSVSVYAFAERLSRFSRPTRDIAKLEQALDAAYKYAHLETRLYESIIQTCRDATQSASNAKRMMLVFSDGFDNGDLTAQAAANAANFFGIQLYPVVLGHDQIEDRAMEQGGARSALNRIGRRAPPRAVQGNPRAGQRLSRARAREAQLAKFAELGPITGGRNFDPSHINNEMIRRIFGSLVRQVQAEYLIGYYPAADEEPRVHPVKIRLKDDKHGDLYGGVRQVGD